MKKGTYESPELVKVGNVKDLTLGGTGVYNDSGGAGSFDPYRPTGMEVQQTPTPNDLPYRD